MNMTTEQILLVAAGALALCFLVAWILAARKAAKWRQDAASAVQQQEFLKERHAQETSHAKLLLDQECAHHKQELAQLEASHAREKQEQESRWNESRKALLEQFRTLATETLSERSRELKKTNEEKMSAIVNPLKEQLKGLGEAVAAAREAEAKNKATLNETIRQMMEQTRQIGTDAVNLTKALKGDSKVQGDWGEMILEQMLEDSGLQRGKHYEIQEVVRDEENRARRPDVVVRFPHERSIIIDSKVSLTAYSRYAAAADDTERAAALKEHVASVRKHVDELAAKDYSHLVQDSIGHVLMFIPNEPGYIAALQAQPQLAHDAYRKNVLIVSPNNLMMALQLAYNLWQNETRVEGIQKIVDQGQKLYEKFALFQQAFTDVGNRLDQANKAYAQAYDRLSRGNGNYLSQVEKLRHMGIQPNANRLLKLDNAELQLQQEDDSTE